jgi:chitodextrinase
MAALGIAATVIAVPRAISGMVGVPQIAEAGINRTAAVTPSAKPSTAKMPVWSATPTASVSTPDTKPPSAVTGLRLLSNSEASISIAWDSGTDNVAVKGYVVKGDGFVTIQTSETKATVSWPRRTATVSVQVSAVDTSGNQGDWRSLSVAPPVIAATATTSAVVTTAPATSSPPVETTTAPPTQPPSGPSTDLASSAPATDAATAVQSAAVQDPGTGILADPSSAQPV